MLWFLLGLSMASPADNCDYKCKEERKAQYKIEETARYDDMKCRGKAGWILNEKIAKEPPSKPCPKKEN